MASEPYVVIRLVPESPVDGTTFSTYLDDLSLQLIDANTGKTISTQAFSSPLAVFQWPPGSGSYLAITSASTKGTTSFKSANDYGNALTFNSTDGISVGSRRDWNKARVYRVRDCGTASVPSGGDARRRTRRPAGRALTVTGPASNPVRAALSLMSSAGSPAMNLSAGRCGTGVADLHAMLTAAGCQVPAAEIKRRFFGPGTLAAVGTAQETHGLPATGIVEAADGRPTAAGHQPAHGRRGDPGHGREVLRQRGGWYWHAYSAYPAESWPVRGSRPTAQYRRLGNRHPRHVSARSPAASVAVTGG